MIKLSGVLIGSMVKRYENCILARAGIRFKKRSYYNRIIPFTNERVDFVENSSTFALE